MANTLARLVPRVHSNSGPPFLIMTSPTLIIYIPSQQNAPLRWRTEKAKHVFLYLLFHANQPVLRDALIDKFWEGFAHQKAAGQLHTTVYLIRKLCAPLGRSLEILSRNGTYTLIITPSSVDFLHLRTVVEAVLQGARELVSQDVALIESFCGEMLTDVTEIWVEPYRAEVDFLLQNMHLYIKSHLKNYAHNQPLRLSCESFVAKYEHHFGDISNGESFSHTKR